MDGYIHFINQDNKRKIRRARLRFFLCFLFGLFVYLLIGYFIIREQIPNKLSYFANQTLQLDYHIPFTGDLKLEDQSVLYINQNRLTKDELTLDLSQVNTIRSESYTSGTCELKLFGILPLKEVDVDFVDEQYLYPGGNMIGIKMNTNGILILGTGKIIDMDGKEHEPALGLVKSGDYILKVDGKPISRTDELKDYIEQDSDGIIVLSIRRYDRVLPVRIEAVKNTGGCYQTGIWIRDSTQGIGTLTFSDAKGHYGALGHGITDIDTGILMNIDKGYLYPATIQGIIKGESGNPGELLGKMNAKAETQLGKISKNTVCGIYGDLNQKISSNPIPIAMKQDIHEGKAYIRSEIEGTVEAFEIEIEQLNPSTEESQKGMVIHVTDDRLLALTNGIIQGMSGSPIIQDGKLIGAVTHVFVNDPTRGYGIFIEEMIENM